MTLLVAILLGALLGSHPALAIVAILYAGTKMPQSESLLACVTQAPQYENKIIAFGRVFG